MSETSPQVAAQPSAVSLYDARPFFEKALQYGVQNGLISQTRLDAMCVEAPKGMVQIAAYFGSEFLRPELEKARERMVNLISLARQFEMQVKMLQTADTNAQRADQLLSLNA